MEALVRLVSDSISGNFPIIDLTFKKEIVTDVLSKCYISVQRMHSTNCPLNESFPHESFHSC